MPVAIPTPNTSVNGITESLINRFSRLRQLRVVPRTTVFRYKRQEENVRDLGRKLNVDAVMTGRVLQRGETLNVQAELVNVPMVHSSGESSTSASLQALLRCKRRSPEKFQRNWGCG
jgi:TolB-like protein